MRTLREKYMNLIYMENRKRQDLLRKLGHEHLERGLKGRGEAVKKAEKRTELNKKQ